jgi:hypothetical protein
VAVLFTWPLALHLSDSFLGPPASDLGVYVWNLWVFRHEIVAHHSFPFFTSEILSLTPRLPLTLQNYTTFANLLAFPVVPLTGIVSAFNLLTLANLVLAAYAMFVYALRRTEDAAAAVLAGLLFGFSPFMTARAAEHFSLIQAAPLPIFGLVMFELRRQPERRLSVLAGVVVAWAFLCDPYYAVYCLFSLAFMVAHSMVTVDLRPEPLRREWRTTLLDLAILSVLGLIVGILLSGGGAVQVLGIRISLSRLYTPVLVLTTLVAARAWILLHPRVKLVLPAWRPSVALFATAVVALMVVLTPVLIPVFAAPSGGFPGPGPVHWRSSSPGLDVAAYLLPNPLNPWIGSWSAAWYQTQPNGFAENVVSIPWVALAVLAAATLSARRWAHAGWVAFTALFALLSLGPFVVIGGMMTHVPGPWALVRYVPVLGAARMPTRLSILVFLGVSMLLAMAVQVLRRRVAWPRTMTAIIAVLLIAELAPGRRTLHSAAIPTFHRTIAADPRPVRVTHLPFGLRDGLSSAGNTSALYQYFQTAHEKPMVGGYVSRLPSGAADRYRAFAVTSALIDLSEGRSLSPERRAEAVRIAHSPPFRLQIGWVIVDTRTASPELEQFAIDAFDLTYVERDGPWKLYRRDLPLP